MAYFFPMQYTYVNMRLIYVTMQNRYVDMQHNNVNMRYNYVYKKRNSKVCVSTINVLDKQANQCTRLAYSPFDFSSALEILYRKSKLSLPL